MCVLCDAARKKSHLSGVEELPTPGGGEEEEEEGRRGGEEEEGGGRRKGGGDREGARSHHRNIPTKEEGC